MDWVRYYFGGSIFSSVTSKGKRFYTVVFNGQEVADILLSVLPYLLIKDEQAKVALEFQSTVNQDHSTSIIPDCILAHREHMYRRISELKIVPAEI